MMQLYFAPMEGVTGYIYRNAHYQFFGGIDKYYMPFVSPSPHRHFTPRQLRDIAPAQNVAVPALPQLMTKNAEDFIWAANELEQMGYREVNLNLGCPSGTVVSKGKGAGFLADPEGLDRFFEKVFSSVRVPISVKTRVGIHKVSEFSRLMLVYNRYPIAELTIHPRLQKDFYKGAVRKHVFVDAFAQSKNPICYNGDLVTEADITQLANEFPTVGSVMLGRGLIADPSLAARAQGKPAADRNTLYAFHKSIYEQYTEAFGNKRNAMLRMKEIWFYHINLFDNNEKYGKNLRKTSDPRDFEAAMAAIYQDLPLRENAVPGWFRPAEDI
ncbi:tRNA dihydrouridine synthase [Agathobaculum sp.]|uniref:tRNA dihydrouridine synthase n=1 Tax=Agathobaculum sp. TaxID=2048138 RepID=UPI002A82204B|nr:tRNA-dihydrouridine synthase family protein [Agathobaculum sp.]MDY3617949.1 tRNA-dihydrouridine synthase family protein [Agathobaculum sp.]